MKLWLPLLVSLPLAGCRTDSAPTPTARTAEPASAQIDLAPLQGKSMSVEQFVVECQKLSGFNFTYSEPTRDAMRRATIESSAARRGSTVDFPEQLETILAPDFHCKRVGPEHLHVLLIEHDPSRG
jgi:hypothetical protein